MSQLPSGWVSSTLGDIAPVNYGRGLAAKDREGSGDVPIVGSAGVMGYHNRALVDDPVIVIGRKGNAGSVRLMDGPSWPIDTVYFVHIPSVLNRRFMALQLEHLQLVELDSSTAIPSLRRQDLEATVVRIPPLREQERIVAAIGDYLAGFEAASTQLNIASRRLAAFEELIYREALSGAGPIRRLGDLVRTASGGTPSRSKPHYFTGRIPWIKSGELGDGIVTGTEEHITDEAVAASSARFVPKGTVLIAMYGATIGRLGVVGSPCATTNQAVAALFPSESIHPTFLWNVLRSLRSRLILLGRGGAQPNISQAILRELLIPVPSLTRQVAVNTQVDGQLGIWRRTSRAVATAKARQSPLRRAVLAAAFSGRLVAQNPDDEPASALLEQIPAERVAATPARRRRTARA